MPVASVRRAWLGLCLALALHVVDEALTGFLDIYNPTVQVLRNQVPWLPFPVFSFSVWLGGLILAVVLLLGLTPFIQQGSTWARRLAYAFAALMIANAANHTVGTLLGRTIGGIEFPRPMPGFYSSPVLLIAAVYLWKNLRSTARVQP